MLATNSVSISSSVNVLASHSFLKAIFAGYRIQLDTYSLSALEKYVPFPSDVFCFWCETCCDTVFEITAAERFCCFQSFLSLVFRNLRLCPGVYFCLFILFGVHSSSWTFRFVSLTKFEEISAIFEYCFSSTFFFFSEILITWMLNLLV